MAPDGDTSMQKKLAEEIIRLLRSVGQTSSKSLQDAQLNRVCNFFENKMNMIKASKVNPHEKIIEHVNEKRKKIFLHHEDLSLRIEKPLLHLNHTRTTTDHYGDILKLSA